MAVKAGLRALPTNPRMAVVIPLPFTASAELEADIIRIVRGWPADVKTGATNGDAARMLAQSLIAAGWKKP